MTIGEYAHANNLHVTHACVYACACTHVCVAMHAPRQRAAAPPRPRAPHCLAGAPLRRRHRAEVHVFGGACNRGRYPNLQFVIQGHAADPELRDRRHVFLSVSPHVFFCLASQFKRVLLLSTPLSLQF